MERLKTIKVLWRQPDTLTLWGVPYEMRPGQAPGDIFRARRAILDRPMLPYGWYGSIRPAGPIPDDWVYLGEPGWYCGSTKDHETVQEFVKPLQLLGAVPGNPYEWTSLADFFS